MAWTSGDENEKARTSRAFHGNRLAACEPEVTISSTGYLVEKRVRGVITVPSRLS